MKKIYSFLTSLILLFPAIALAQPSVGTTLFAWGSATLVQPNGLCSPSKTAAIVGWQFTIASTTSCSISWATAGGGDGHVQLGSSPNATGLWQEGRVASNNGSSFQLKSLNFAVPTGTVNASFVGVSMIFKGYKSGSLVSGATVTSSPLSAQGITVVSAPVNVSFTNNANFNDVDEIRVTPSSPTVTGNWCLLDITIGASVTPCTTPTISVVGSTNVSCNGGSNGSATMTASGGPGFTYTWSPSGGNASIATGLSIGIYTCAITNSCGSTDSETVQITQPSALATSTAVTNALCNGNTGTGTVTASGGTSPYTYTWSSGSTNSFVTLLASTYTVKVTDANSCTSTKSVTIGEPSALVTSTAITNPFCNGGQGSATVTASGGTGAYSYTWSSGPTTSIEPTLLAGTYTVKVTDANSCTITKSVTIGQPSALSTSTAMTSPLCNGAQGSATVTASGGTGAYSYTWSSGPTVSVEPTLLAGTYTVKVTDANSCTSTKSVTITQPSAIGTSTGYTNVFCNGGVGSASILASGGTSPYTYTWSTGATGTFITNQPAGSYTVKAIDANNCNSSTRTITISQPAAIVITTLVTNALCNGGQGSATVTVSGGVPSYGYNWSSGPTTSVEPTLLAGTYTVMVYDVNSCTKTATVNISQPAALVTSTAVTNAPCNGGTGSATVTASGGTGAYTYSWTSGATASVVTGLPAGNYSVTVTDANSCTSVKPVTITQPTSGLATSTAVTNVLCNGGNGSATITVSGGTGPYTYTWSSSATASFITSLAGTYAATVTDVNGCTGTNSVTISQPAALVTTTAVTNVLCNGGNGSATITATGGTGAYTYTWSSGATASVATGLASGAYTVTVTDANGCTSTKSVNISQPSALATSIAGTSIQCNGGTGSATITASGGTGAYTYSWTSGATASVAISLSAGSYGATVTDANGCTSTKTLSISQPASALATSTAVTNASCNGGTGSATITASGGTGAYTYSWSSGPTTSVVTGLAGAYTATVTDANGCTSTKSVTITQPSALVTTTAVTNVLCNGGTGSATITASGGAGAYTYSWSSSATTSVITGVSGVYTATVTDANSCTSTKSVTITQPSALVTSTAVTNVLCNGGTGSATITASGGTGAYTYLWSGGATASVVAGLNAGAYSATVTDANGCPSVKSVSISAPPALTLSAVASSASLCTGNSVTLTASGSGGTGSIAYAWVSGPTTGTYAVSPSSNTTYTVNITDANSCTASQTVAVTVVSGPTLTVNSGSVCTGSSFTITPSGATSYTYSGGSAVVSPTVTTNYTVTGTGANGCVNSTGAVSSVSVAGLPTITVNSGSICSGNSFTMNPSGALTYTYSSGSAIVTPPSNTSYTVTGTDANGCVNTTGAVSTVTVNTTPTISVNSGSVCAGQSFTLVASGATTYTYSGGSAVVTPTATSSYTVTGSSAQGCPAVSGAVSTITVNPNATISVSGGSICLGESFTLTPSGASTYTYSGGSAIVSPTTTTSYTVSGTSASGCVSATGAVATVTVNTAPVITVNSGGICTGNSFTITPSGATSYTFSGGSAIVSPTANTTYTVTGTGADGCVNTTGAVSTVTINPTPTITVNSGTICSGQSFSIVASGASTYTYSGGSAVISPTATTDYTVTGTSLLGCVNPTGAVSSVTVYALPVISVNSGSICVGQSFTMVPSGATSYTYSGGSAVVSPTGTTSYTVTGTNANGCVGSSGAVSTVTVNALPIITVNSGSICSGNAFTITPSGASTYTYSGGSAIVSPTVNTSYTVTGTDALGCVNPTGAVSGVTVSTSPTISIGNFNICAGNSVTLNPTGASSYTYLNGGPVVTPAATTSYSITGSNGAGCPATNTAVSTVTVNALPVLAVNSGSICVGQSFTMVPSGAASYTYSSGSAVVSPTGTTSYTVTGTGANGCSDMVGVVSTVTVNALPIITVNSGSICSGNAFTITPSGASTYTYSGGSAVVSPTVNTSYTVTGTDALGCVNPTGAVSGVTVSTSPTISIGNFTICSGGSATLNPTGAASYTYSSGSAVVSPTATTSYSITGSNGAGCPATNTAVTTVVVNTLPVISVNSGSICSGEAFTITASGAISYTYSGGSAVVSPTIDASYTVTGTDANGCVSATGAVSQVTVHALPVLAINSGSMCPGNSFTLAPSGAATYTYLNGGPVVTPSVTTSYSVTGTSSVGCPASNIIVSVVTVSNTLVVTITGSANICSGLSASLTANGASTYSWTTGSTSSVIVVTPSTTTTYTVYGVSGTCSNNAVVTVTVNTTPTVSIAGTSTLCSGNSVALTASGANTYSWDTGATTASISVSPTVDITYTVTGNTPAGCSDTKTFAVTVYSVPVITVNSGSICSGSSFTIVPSGASTYTYSGGSAVVTPNATTNYTVTGTSSQGCTVTTGAVSSVTVNITPTISVANGTICEGQSFTMTPSGASTYTYSNGSAVVSPTTTTSYSVTGTSAQGCVSTNTAVSAITVNTLPIIAVNSGSICSGEAFTITASGASSYTYSGGSAVVSPTISTSYTVNGTGANGCVSGTAAVSDVTVHALPTLSLSGGSICPGNNFTLTPTGAATYTYLNGGPVVTPASTTSYSVAGSSSVGCPGSNTVVAVVTVSNTLVMNVTGASTLCSGQSATLTANGASTYSWTTGSTSSVIVVTPSTTTTYTVYGVSGTCSNNVVVTVTVFTTPTVSIAGTSTLCSGNSVALTASGANSYSWTTGATTASISVSPTTTTTYSAMGTTTAGCSDTKTFAVTVYSVPVITVNSGSICSNYSFTMVPSGATSYTFSSGSAVVSPTVTSNYTVTGTSSDGCTVTTGAVSSVTVNITPTISVANGTICEGQSFTMTPSGASTYTYSNGSAVVSPTTTTSYSVTGTSAQGCVSTNTAVSAITVNTLPIIAVNSGSICSGTSFTIVASGASSYTYSGGSAVVSPTTTSSYTVTGTGANGCVSGTAAVSDVTVHALPTLSLSGGSICPGNNFTLVPSGATTYTYLNGGPVVTPASTTSYSVAGSSSVGCPGSNTVVAVVTVSNTLVMNVTGASTLCSGQSATLTGNGASTYSWTTGSTSSVIVVTPSTTTTYTVYGVSGTCSNNVVVTVTVFTTPTVSIAGTNTLCSGNSVALTASGANSYSWTTSALTASISVSPTVSTTYTALGTTTAGCTDTETFAVTAYTIPVVTVNSGSICSNNSFTMVPSGATSYTFSSGGAVVSPTVTSNYTVTGTSSDGCTVTAGAVSTVTVYITPTISVANGTICEGQSFTLAPTGAGSGSYAITGGSTVVSPTITTSYSIVGTSTAGCVSSNTAVSAIAVNTLPIISVNSGSICSGVSFTMIPSGAASYTYQGGSAVVSPTTTSSYSVTGTGANGCVSGTTAISQVTVHALPTLSINSGQICPGNNFTLTPTGAATYTYLNGGPVVTPASTTSYSVAGSSSVGCPATNTVVSVVTVSNTLLVGITGSANICSGQSASLTATGATTYSWTTGATTASVSVNPLVNTTYTVYGVSGTCSNNAVVTVTVNTTPTVAIAGTNTLCNGGSVVLTASGANTYSWNTGATTASISVNPTSNTTYSVTGNTPAGCSDTKTMAVTVYTLPVITVNSGSICSGNSFTMTPSGAFSYTYSSGSAIVTPSATGSYTVTGTSAVGCISATGAVSSVTVNTTPTISVNNGTICAGQSFTLVASGASTYVYQGGSATVTPASSAAFTVTGTSAQGCPGANTATAAITVYTLPIISVNSGSICNGNSFVMVPSGAASYTYSSGSATVAPATNTSYVVTGTGANGCVNSTGAVSQVTVHALPTIAVNSGTICPGNSFTLNPTGAANYTYLNGGPSVTPAITTSYSVTATSSVGCAATNTAVAVVTVSNSLVVTITGSANICSGQAATLTGGGATTYSWSSGPTTNTVSLNPLTNTTYTLYGVTGTCSNNAIVTVTVNTTPTVSIAGTNTLCQGGSTSFTASGASSYSWSTNATTSVVTVSPSSSAVYSVTGTTTAGCSATAAVSSTVFVLPTITVNSGTICLNQVFTMTPSGANSYTYSSNSATVSPTSNTSYTVTGTSTAGCLGAAVVSSVVVNSLPTITVNSGSICVGQSFVIVPGGASSYVITGGSATVSPLVNTSYSVTGTNSLGCIGSNTAVSNVTVNINPTVSIVATQASVCPGNSSTLTASGATSYTWSTGANTGSIVSTPTAATLYTVTGANSFGCASTASQTIDLFTSPAVNIASSSASVCAGFSSSLTASGLNTYTWNTGANTASISVTPSVNTTYTVNGNDLNGCAGSGTVLIALNPMPTVTAASASVGVCSGFSTAVTANGASTYSWSTGATTGSIAASPTVSTIYTVTGTSGAGCLSTATVEVLAYQSPTVSLGADVEVGLNASYQFTPSQSLAVSYTWTPGTNLNATNILNPVVSPLFDETYVLKVTSANGCTASDTINVKVLTELIIANYMSPNSDGVNDNWKVNVPSIIRNYSIDIIDSYGQVVYSKASDYNNEFDGKRNGDYLPDGTYYYFIKDGSTIKYKGSITLTK